LHHARRVAEHVGADHHEFIVRADALEVLPTLVEHYGEPYADSSAIHFLCSPRNAQACDRALNGDGGRRRLRFERYRRCAWPKRLIIEYRGAARVRSQTGDRATASSETKRSRVRDVKRFVQAASLPKVELNLRG